MARPRGRNYIIRKCPVCSTTINTYKSQNKKYCSNRCAHIAIKERSVIINNGKIPWNKGKVGLQKHSKETKLLLRNNRLNYMSKNKGNFKDTDIEILMKDRLNLEKIHFKQSKRIRKYCVDFLIGNTVIECDGVYWHNRPGDKLKDIIRDLYILSKGYTILRFSEYNLKNNMDDCIKFIKNKI